MTESNNATSGGDNTRNNANATPGDGGITQNNNTTSTAHIEKYYNKFNEDHRLTTRHGIVEFTVTMQAIEDCAEELRLSRGDARHSNNVTLLAEGTPTLHSNNVNSTPLKIADIGAGTGRYSIALAQKGYDVTAVELVKHNLEVLRSKHQNVKTWQGDARNLHFLPDNTFDITLLFGPLYHLHGTEEKLKAIKETMRITKKGGKILIAYVMNEYSVISYCFKTHHWQEVAQKNGLTEDFHTISTPDELYDYVRLSDINNLNQLAGLKRQKIIAPDGPADYMRRELNEMSAAEFQAFIDFQKANCARPELLGASSHIVDICTF